MYDYFSEYSYYIMYWLHMFRKSIWTINYVFILINLDIQRYHIEHLLYA